MELGVRIEWNIDVPENAGEAPGGFNVYRRDHNEDYYRLNTAGPLSPQSRSFLDTTARPGRSYEYRVGVIADGAEIMSTSATVTMAPGNLALHQNSPNPFNPSTTIGFELDTRDHVTLVVYDAAGRRVRTLIDGPRDPGYGEAVWDGRSDAGSTVGTGIYIYRLTAGKRSLSRKMLLLK
jgi:hypothetical protein